MPRCFENGNGDFGPEAFRARLLGRILKVGVQNFKQGVQGSNVHVLFNPASPRRSPFLSRETPRRSPISRSRCWRYI